MGSTEDGPPVPTISSSFFCFCFFQTFPPISMDYNCFGRCPNPSLLACSRRRPGEDTSITTRPPPCSDKWQAFSASRQAPLSPRTWRRPDGRRRHKRWTRAGEIRRLFAIYELPLFPSALCPRISCCTSFRAGDTWISSLKSLTGYQLCKSCCSGGIIGIMPIFSDSFWVVLVGF